MTRRSFNQWLICKPPTFPYRAPRVTYRQRIRALIYRVVGR